MMRIACVVLLVVVFFGCQKNVQPTTSSPAQPIATPRMIFLNFNITVDSAGKHVVTMLGKKTVDGIRKKSSWYSSPSYILIQLLDGNAQVVQRDTTEHPLIRNMEYVNDDKEFERKIVTLKEADFSVRLNLPAGAQYVNVTEVINKESVASAQFPIQ